MFGKLKEKLRQRRIRKTLDHLSDRAVVLTNNYTTTYAIEGPRTYGYLDMWKTVTAAFDLVYPKGYMGKYVYGLFFTENEDKIIVHLITPRPGMIIGKSGGKIDWLTETLKKCFDKDTEIKLQETELLLGMQWEDNY